MDRDLASTPTVEQERRLVTAVPGPASQRLHARKLAAVSAGVGTMLPIYVERAAGGILVDVDGNHLIDFGSGIAVTNVGNAAPEVARRVTQQVGEFTHTCFMVTPYEAYVQVCEALNRLTPGRHEKRSALFNTGAEAVENAVKIARRFTGRDAVVVFDHGYHGRTNLTMAMTAKNMPYKDGFGPFASEIYRVPMSYPFREPAPISGEQAAARAITAIDKQVGINRTAAVVIEPIQGEGGFVVPAPGFLTAIAAWCAENGILFVADEVQTGFARTGAMFACEHEGIVPDMIITAKGIAGGLPLAAVTGRADIMDSVHGGGLGGTYGGNPVACAGALAAIDLIEGLDLVSAARRIESVMLARLQELAAAHPGIGDVRGRGAMLAIEIVKPGTRETTKEPDPAEAARISAACHQAGVVTLTCGTYGNVLRFLPPLVIPEHLLAEGLDILAGALAG
ncbi:MAG: 4-aminobutyrate--2-oxoglutarate transaminase [Kineosporiaceae bacterium]|nr:4-aminobutyrate--2-oxoglutarate transaminase [Kineosporiaceae bacterium]